MKKYFMSVAALAGMMSLAACSSDDIVSPADNDVQTIKIAVASTGDKSTRSRDLNSEEPAQNIENVAVVIRNKATNAVVYHKVITNWNTETVSKPYTDNGHGRECTLKLEGAERLNAGEYTITAVGYTAADFKNNTIEGATGVVPGNFTAEVADGKAAQEAFAGESSINLLENHAAINTSVTLHRQVAGYYGYFTSIPVEVNSKKVTDVRLVARSKNMKLTYGNFNSSFTTTNSDIMYVVNGSEPATTKDAKFNGSTTANDAYTLYNIKVTDWFTQGDTNNDGILDEKDNGWTNALATKGYLTYQEGTIFAGGFAVPFAAVDAATLELQLLDASGEILKSWTVAMATVQPTGKGVDGVDLTVPETTQNFSFFRNHMYTLGKKMDNTNTPGTTPDQPEPLDKSQSMILRVNDNWEVINRMTIGD